MIHIDTNPFHHCSNNTLYRCKRKTMQFTSLSIVIYPLLLTISFAVATGERPIELSTRHCVDSDWTDVLGYDCAEYNEHQYWCKNAASFVNKDGISALSACCICGGGRMNSNDPTIAPTTATVKPSLAQTSFPSLTPTTTADATTNNPTALPTTTAPSGQPNKDDDNDDDDNDDDDDDNDDDDYYPVCTDFPNYRDVDDYGCDEYEQHPFTCSDAFTNKYGVSPLDACCVCYGGNESKYHTGKVYIKSQPYGNYLRFLPEDEVDLSKHHRSHWEQIELVAVKGGNFLIKSDYFSNLYLSVHASKVHAISSVTSNEEFEIVERMNGVSLKHVKTQMFLKASEGDYAKVSLTMRWIDIGTSFFLERRSDLGQSKLQGGSKSISKIKE